MPTPMIAIEQRAAWLEWVLAPGNLEQMCASYTPKTIELYTGILHSGPTFYMDRHFCDLVDRARLDVPNDLKFESEWMVEPYGWMWLEEPYLVPDMEVADDLKGHPLENVPFSIGAVGWARRPDGQYQFCNFIDFGRIRNRTNIKKQVSAKWPFMAYEWGSWSYFAIRDGDQLSDRIDKFEETAQFTFGAGQYRHDTTRSQHQLHEIRWCYTAFYLMSQKLATRAVHGAPRAIRRRLAKQAKPVQPPPFVQVVTLRRMQADRNKDPQGRNVDWQWQWFVGHHWRRQWYPSEGIHKPVLIESYLKGPPDKPIKPPSTRIYRVAR